jgi:hypothetical protein
VLDLEDPRSVPFNIDVVYAAGGGTPHGMYVKVSIVFCEVLLAYNTYFYCRFALGDGVVDHGSYA